MVQIPWFNGILHTVPLTLTEWAGILAAAGAIIVVDEIYKRVAFRAGKIAYATMS